MAGSFLDHVFGFEFQVGFAFNLFKEDSDFKTLRRVWGTHTKYTINAKFLNLLHSYHLGENCAVFYSLKFAFKKDWSTARYKFILYYSMYIFNIILFQ